MFIEKICNNLDCPNKGKPYTNLKKCGACHVRSYCSVECQKAAWKDGHKIECERIREVWKKGEKKTKK